MVKPDGTKGEKDMLSESERMEAKDMDESSETVEGEDDMEAEDMDERSETLEGEDDMEVEDMDERSETLEGEDDMEAEDMDERSESMEGEDVGNMYEEMKDEKAEDDVDDLIHDRIGKLLI